MTISRFAVGSLDDIPADLRARIEPIAARSGFVPNVFIGLLHRPDELRAFMDYHDALMEREESGLSKAEREMIVVATSAANDCLYCVVAHGAILRVRAKDAQIADRIAANWRTAPVTDRQRAMLSVAVKLARRPERIDESDLESLRAHGFTDDDIWDIGAITAFFAHANRLAHLMDLQPNDEFFTMGRAPRS
jgi:uncharacterized peroxidase-related enzyme